MTAQNDESVLAKNKQFLDSIEKVLRAANREIIHKHIPKITGEDVTKLAIVVAELRARYLDISLALVDREEGVAPDSAEINKLSKAREMFDEATHAFEALRRAIERGYVEIAG